MINKYPCINVYENRKKNSKLSSQILYGEKFSITKKYRHFYKIKTGYDKYVGFIKKRKFEKFAFKPTHKVSSLKANVFSKPIKSSKIKMKLSAKLTSSTFNNIRKWGFKNKHIGPAIFSYQGTAFKHMDTSLWSEQDLTFSQNSVLILSAYYGLLRPLDQIAPYRLEMGSKLKGSHGNSLNE